MTIDQALDLLKAHRRKATLAVYASREAAEAATIRGRRRGAHRKECPLTFLARVHLGLSYTVQRWQQAGAALGIPEAARLHLVDAADFRRPEDAWLRRRLLAALDLPQEG